ncbi:MAG: alpha/beta hydrolase [Alphaproteobacteria bacterium]|nr:alpha/beta hydrolase [Alphaproteobacteria bacterium]
MPESFRSIPHEKAEANEVIRPNGIRLKLYRMIGPVQEGPVLLFGHANGMAAGSYLRLLEELALEATVFAFDARGHGGSSAPETELDRHYNMDAFADDLEAITESVRNEIGEAPLYYVAHSLNAIAGLRLGALRKRPFWEGVTLFEPPVFPPDSHPLYGEAMQRTDELVRLSQNRKARWPSPDVLTSALKGRSLFSLFEEGRLLDYARANLRPTGKGDYTLASPPEVEAAIFACHMDSVNYEILPDFPMPVRFVSGDPEIGLAGDWIAKLAPDLAARVPGSALTVVEETSHLLLFEATIRTKACILAMLPG